MLQSIKKKIGLKDFKIGWDQSTIIRIKTSGRYEGDVDYRYKQMANYVRSCFEDILCLKRKEIEVSVSTEHLSQSCKCKYLSYSFVSLSKCTLISIKIFI